MKIETDIVNEALRYIESTALRVNEIAACCEFLTSRQEQLRGEMMRMRADLARLQSSLERVDNDGR